jgi:hypothetical protein
VGAAGAAAPSLLALDLELSVVAFAVAVPPAPGAPDLAEAVWRPDAGPSRPSCVASPALGSRTAAAGVPLEANRAVAGAEPVVSWRSRWCDVADADAAGSPSPVLAAVDASAEAALDAS